ncbi:DNA independent RNA polymerase I transcription factor [Friedmanniomyces endolithicus]|nr:DNA independent RNA polymerase I transcription factor [Friedmanniomyces endolithicus]
MQVQNIVTVKQTSPALAALVVFHASGIQLIMVSLASSSAGAMLPPPTSLHRRPTLGLKRDSSFLDTDDEAGLSSQTKRLKVAFSPKVDVRIMDDWSEKSYDLVKEEVRLGIEQHLAPGDRREGVHYAKLLQVFGQHVGSDEAPSGGLLKKYLLAINARVNALGQCTELVGAILDLAWLGRDDVFDNLYVRFLMGLATAHSKYVSSIMEKLVSHFARLPASLGRLPGEIPVPRPTMFKRVHRAVQSLLRQVPSATAALTRVLKSEFPDDLATSRSYLQYQKHLLRVVEYLPELKAEILAVLTQRLVSIDVQVQQDLEDLEDEAEESLLQQKPRPKTAQSGLGDSDDSDEESVSESEETMTGAEQRVRELRLKVAKMDGTMDLLFEYYTPLVQSGLRAELNDAYHQLLAHFETFILPNRTRHAQFLVFHFSQTLPEHGNLFARQCLHAIFETGRSLSLRVHACAYLASFVARGSHLPTALVREIFAGLSQELESMRKRYEPTCRGPDKRSYSVYYAVAQAMLYIFCFRWRDLLLGAEVPEDGDEDLSEEDLVAEGRELAWLPGMKESMQKSIHSRLNPLKVCSPAITGEFARLALHVRFLYVFSILESNKRVRLGNVWAARSSGPLSEIGRRETAMDRKLGEAHLQLEAYFPFDPYHLPRSKRWVEGDYNEWKLPAGMMPEDDELDESSDESDEDSILDELEDDLPEADGVSVSS